MVDGFRWMNFMCCQDSHKFVCPWNSSKGNICRRVCLHVYCRTNYTYTTYWLILHQLPKTQASNSKNSVPMIDSHFYNSFAWIESNFFHSDCHFSWAWPVSHAHYIRSHSRMGSLRMRLVSRMQLSVNSLYTRSSVSDLLWFLPRVVKLTVSHYYPAPLPLQKRGYGDEIQNPVVFMIPSTGSGVGRWWAWHAQRLWFSELERRGKLPF